jgi:hypothetical protein
MQRQSAKISEEELRRWLSDDFPRHYRFRLRVGAFIHNQVPKEFRLWPMTHWLFKTALACSAPVVSALYGILEWFLALITAGGLFIANSLVGVLAKISEAKPGAASDTNEIVRVGDLVNAVSKSRIAKQADRDAALEACLGLIQHYAMRTSKSKAEEISVTLMLYVGSSMSKLRITKRNPGNHRPQNREVDGEGLFGHHACRAGDAPQVLHNLDHYPSAKISPTQQTVPYKTLFIIPLQSTKDDSRMCGFVSIDCVRPYAFFGNRATSLFVTCEPIIALIRGIVGEQSR